MNTKKNIIKYISIVLLIIIVIVLTIYVAKYYLEKNDKKSKLEIPIVDTFLYDFRDGYDYSSGTAQLLGYVEIENRSNSSSNNIYEYVTFHILESNSEEFMKYLKSNADNIYVKEDSIGLGCLVDNKIELINYSDLYVNDGFTVSIGEPELNTKEFLKSTKDNPIRINIVKNLNTKYYSYHPVCESMLSFFSQI